jgi:hypothetical protein
MPRSGKLTLKAIANRKFGNLAMIRNHWGYYVRETRETAYPPSWRWRISLRSLSLRTFGWSELKPKPRAEAVAIFRENP